MVRTFTVKNLDKVFWPDLGLTKAHLMAYYDSISRYILPHLRDRPLVTTRYPDGIAGKSFYQKNLPDYTPEWVERYPYYSKDSDRIINFCLASDRATLGWLASQACLELHPWLSRIQHPLNPDFAVFDFDPAEPAGTEEVREALKMLKKVLDELNLVGYVKTSGATGYHVYVPLRPVHTYRQTATFVQKIGEVLRAAAPDLITLERTIAKRRGKVYVDYLQNVLGKTIASVYSPRPLPGAPVSVPITWEELDRVAPGDFNILNTPERVRECGDLFAGALVGSQVLPAIE